MTFQEWRNNKEALLSYIEATHLGVKGFVLDEGRQPIRNADVVVEGNAKRVRSTERGEYWRLLAPGTYRMFAAARGFHRSEPVTVTVGDSGWPPSAQIKHFVLRRKAAGQATNPQ